MKKWTAKAPDSVKSWDRVRIYVNLDDYRCVGWPPLGPYWCSGESDSHSIVVAYVPHGTTDKEIMQKWPEVKEVDRMQQDVPITFSDRFPKPDWWVEWLRASANGRTQ